MMDHYYQRYFIKPQVPPKQRRWSLGETDRLVVMLKEGMRPAKIGKELGRSIQSIQSKAEQIGIKIPRRPNCWTQDELKTLCDLVARGATYKEFYKALPNRTHGSIAWHVMTFGGVKAHRS